MFEVDLYHPRIHIGFELIVEIVAVTTDRITESPQLFYQNIVYIVFRFRRKNSSHPFRSIACKFEMIIINAWMP